ncbi:MAG: PD40 domain-containing protein, partial [Saprospiraceae bacterium]|nr:PD40 domain-containing protein [Saprospiraceae bacterium]
MKYLSVLFMVCLTCTTHIQAQNKNKKEKINDDEQAKKSLPLQPDRKIHLQTSEGTWLNLDVSPDGKTIAFDMMGDLYLLPIAGGKATRLTKGMAYETHPKFSPDGRTLCFTSDSSGAENIWIMDVKTKSYTQITKD